MREELVSLPVSAASAAVNATGTQSEGRWIPRLQIYRVSAQTDRLLIWSWIRCDAPGPKTKEQ